ncbi:uncharacterized protein M421DRAFT_89018 [Didymella exigua CBS 183.55]|uniref:Uncharacterized protein n=1 Tax=Didymella exigua CBS 183.55 TaxID=1150837 RepID=A0A6A5RZI3_9PLEO|nr:uncharacterized protein M421DRAFT_89018 [Didymella exigua CBS 183.55]KAF1932644.1 hypothetical protein M421DRAFT_89018 [Didymella exigua CBS 183.55]
MRNLRSPAPGMVLLYQECVSIPLWPAVHLTDDVTPQSFLATRPPGLHSIVLKLSRVADYSYLRWALTSQMTTFDPSAADKETKRTTPGLQEAYDIALDSLDVELPLEYWKAILDSIQEEELPPVDNDQNGFDSDPEMAEAIRMGIIDVPPQIIRSRQKPPVPRMGLSSGVSKPSHSRRVSSVPHQYDTELPLPIRKHPQPPSSLLTLAPSPLVANKSFSFSSRPPKRSGPPTPAYVDDDLLSPTQRRKLGRNTGAERASAYQTTSQSTQGISSSPFTFSDDSEDELPPPPPRGKSSIRRPASVLPLSAQDLFLNNGLRASTPAAPDADVIEEDLYVECVIKSFLRLICNSEESNQFVQVFVGPEIDPANGSDIDPQRRKYKLQLLKQHVWDRPYFRDALSARNYIGPIGENTWELVHPRLVDISPEDFRWAAEYLSGGDFGHREPETEEEVKDTFAQCMSARRTAELLNMDDLLEHIVDKIRAFQPWWDLWNVMAFAVSIYQSEVSLQAHDDLKELFTGYIADLFYIYIEDDHISTTFTDRLKQLPELERDVLKKRFAQLEHRLQPQEEKNNQ